MEKQDKNRLPPATEMELFLPGDGSNVNNSSKYKVSLKPRDQEDNLMGPGSYDPFKNRALGHATTDCDTVTHLLKASLGTGILAMPIAFKFSGLSVGIAATLLVAVVCTHCSYILVKCAHHLYYTTRVSSMSFADVGEVAFANGPTFAHKYSKFIRLTILVSLFATYFGTCSVYTVIIGNNFQQVIEHYSQFPLDQRIYIAALLIPLILLSWVPNLKYLAPVSMVANVFMGLGLGITVYYLVQELPDVSSRPQYAPIIGMPQFMSIVIFAMEAIGVVMPLENHMKTPRHFLGLCGVLNQGMSGVTLIYIMLGFLGYLKYGDKTMGSITLNLPQEEIAAQIVKVLIGLAVFCTYGLQFFVCLEIAWNGIKERFSNKLVIREYFLRTLLVTLTVALAVSVPTISPFIGLIGSLCFSTLGLIIPAFIELITFWEEGFGTGYYRIWKNVLVIVFGVMALLFGSYTSILDIVALYKP